MARDWPMVVDTISERSGLARVRVLSGGERHEATFELGHPSRMTIGSDLSATLRIERADVAPRQLDLIWDGTQLWIQDGLRLGRTFVNGVTLNEWVCIIGQAIVCFGGVRLWLTSHSAPGELRAPDFAALDRASLTDDHQNACVRKGDTGRFTIPPELLELNERDAR